MHVSTSLNQGIRISDGSAAGKVVVAGAGHTQCIAALAVAAKRDGPLDDRHDALQHARDQRCGQPEVAMTSLLFGRGQAHIRQSGEMRTRGLRRYAGDVAGGVAVSARPSSNADRTLARGGVVAHQRCDLSNVRSCLHVLKCSAHAEEMRTQTLRARTNRSGRDGNHNAAQVPATTFRRRTLRQDYSTALTLDQRERQHWIKGPHPGMRLFLLRLPGGRKDIVLYVHGARFPSALSVAHRFDGRSWRDALCEGGFDVWALDFHGFGGSDHYPEMEENADTHGPLCPTSDAYRQLDAAVRTGAMSLVARSLLGNDGRRALRRRTSHLVDRSAFFAPITRREGTASKSASDPAWRVITNAAQHARFVEDVPPSEPPVLSRVHLPTGRSAISTAMPIAAVVRPPASRSLPDLPLKSQRPGKGNSLTTPAGSGRRLPFCAVNGTASSLIPMRAGYGVRWRNHRSA
jgi:hypothetical protein